jgi:antitoxin component of MazEF toxin-antitoxin module
MVKTLQRVGNSRGIIIDKNILSILNVPENGAFDMTLENGAITLKPVNMEDTMEKIYSKHKASYDKLGK